MGRDEDVGNGKLIRDEDVRNGKDQRVGALLKRGAPSSKGLRKLEVEGCAQGVCAVG